MLHALIDKARSDIDVSSSCVHFLSSTWCRAIAVNELFGGTVTHSYVPPVYPYDEIISVSYTATASEQAMPRRIRKINISIFRYGFRNAEMR